LSGGSGGKAARDAQPTKAVKLSAAKTGMDRRFGAHDRIASDTLLPFSVFADKHYRERDPRQVAASIVLAQCRAPAVWVIKFQIYLATQADRGAGAASIILSCRLVLTSLLHSRDLHDLDNLYPRPRHVQVRMILAE
jgi:hypothetical protein